MHSEADKVGSVSKRSSPMDVCRLLPKINCKECGEDSCMAFAVKVANREVRLEVCPALLAKQHEEAYRQLKDLLRPAVKEVTIGIGERAVRIGGKAVMYRHELAYANPTAIAIDLTDEMPEDKITTRIRKVGLFRFEYIGQPLRLELIALRSTSNDPNTFKAVVKTAMEETNLPLILCSLKPKVLEAGLEIAGKSRPLLYAATKENWKEMAELARAYNCPLTVSAPNDLQLLRSLTNRLLSFGIEDLVLDPGALADDSLAETLNCFTMIRLASCKRGDRLLGFPLMGAPMVAWMRWNEAAEDIKKWREAYLAAMLIVRYADLLLLHNTDGWALLPLIILRQNIYTDPRKPAMIKAGLRIFGTPEQDSPVMFTTNFALTYFTVASDIDAAKLDAYLLVVDTGGIAVDSAVAGRKLTAEKVAAILESSGIESKVKHRVIVIPGKSARLARDIEELSGWQVLVGPRDSSDISGFLKEKWHGGS